LRQRRLKADLTRAGYDCWKQAHRRGVTPIKPATRTITFTAKLLISGTWPRSKRDLALRQFIARAPSKNLD